MLLRALAAVARLQRQEVAPHMPDSAGRAAGTCHRAGWQPIWVGHQSEHAPSQMRQHGQRRRRYSWYFNAPRPCISPHVSRTCTP